MSSTRPAIHLSDLVGKLYAHKREKEERLREAADRRAVAAALKDPRLKSVKLEERARPVSPDDPSLTRDSAKKAKRLVTKRRRWLKQVSEGAMTTAELRGRDAAAFDVLREHAGDAWKELHHEEGVKRLQEGGTKAFRKPTAWKYTVAELSKVAPTSIARREHELYGEGAYEWRLERYGAKVSGGDPIDDDELAVQFARLDREGYTEAFLAELWERYPDDAVDAKLPKPGGGGKSDAPGDVSVTPIDDDSHLSTARLAEIFRVPADALRTRLNRWRAKNDAGWIENPDRKSREAKYLYRAGSIRDVIDALKATSETTSERPAKKK